MKRHLMENSPLNLPAIPGRAGRLEAGAATTVPDRIEAVRGG